MTYTISQAAAKAGVSIYTLRYYDKEGLLPFLDKKEDGTRVFKESDFEWLKTVSCLKDTGMSIREIRDFISLCVQGDETLGTRLEILKKHQADFEEKMAQMEQYRTAIQRKVQYYEDALAEVKTYSHAEMQ